ncbi:Alkaline protease 1-like protein 4 [Colletotrichum chlorophyti]|uniref:Alkaline protease 1-like protein 4 n=1 Tax=Colletotrichum chlorophyti TaxID=708187 RepID=A0A1Q8RWU7_9PEZI|nr:Alkaline protease 1-like protein 4 [Colletotrichum chlorophyti]
MVRLTAWATVLSALIPALTALPLEGSRDDSATYIVSFKRGLNGSDIDSHFDFADDFHHQSSARRGFTPGLAGKTGIIRRHHIDEHRSYTAVFDKETRDAVASHPAVALVERDEEVGIGILNPVDTEDVNYEARSTGGLTPLADGSLLQADAPWGLVSVSFDHDTGVPQLGSVYRFPKDAQGESVYVYVVDTGVRTTHVEFEGRAKHGANFVEGEDDADNMGHGTHVAGTVGGKTFGVAKKANIIAVKALDKNGKGNVSGLVAAFNWVAADAKKNKRQRRSIINYSVGGKGAASKAFRDAILAVQKLGIPVFAAAGNDGADVKDTWPANMKEVFTVASTNSLLKRASTSNYGATVDIWGPGEDIRSCGHKSDKATVEMSGTSMATPHVAGLAASFKSLWGSDVDHVEVLYQSIRNYAAVDKVKDAKGSVNLFIANGLLTKGRDPPTYNPRPRPPM